MNNSPSKRNVQMNIANAALQTSLNPTAFRNTETVIDIDIDTDSISQHLQQAGQTEQLNSQQAADSVSEINFRGNSEDVAMENSNRMSSLSQRNLMSLISEVRSHFWSQTSGSSNQQQHEFMQGNTDSTSNTSSPHQNAQNQQQQHRRSWRMNLNNVLALSSSSPTQTLRSLISNPGSFRFNAVNPGNYLRHASQSLIIPQRSISIDQPESGRLFRSTSLAFGSSIMRLSSNQLLDRFSNIAPSNPSNQSNRANLDLSNSTTSQQHCTSGDSINVSVSGHNNININESTQTDGQNARHLNAESSTVQIENQQENVDNDDVMGGEIIPELVMDLVSTLSRYSIFLCIAFMKFFYDNLVGIMDILVLQMIMYSVNYSLRKQVAKLSQKNYIILLMDCLTIVIVVSSRIVISGCRPDPFGLLVRPMCPQYTTSQDLALPVVEETTTTATVAKSIYDYVIQSPNTNSQVVTTPSTNHSSSDTSRDISSSNSETLSMLILVYYIAVNDLLLKLLTQLIKIIATILPSKLMRYKTRGRLFAFVEYCSQFYRAFVPIREWLQYLFTSYSGLEMIAGLLFTSLYMSAKFLEMGKRSKMLEKSFAILLRNIDHQRTPTEEELHSTENICPICHDNYNSPVALQCNHIFCDDCVSTWLKREETCPMCRVKVTDDPSYQDGSTTYFYQLF